MNNAVREAIARRLREARLSAKLSQSEVGQALKVKRQAVSAWENGRAMPRPQLVYELGLLYGSSLDLIVYGVQSPTINGMLRRIFSRGAEVSTEDGQA